jgi:hypothetical protein
LQASASSTAQTLVAQVGEGAGEAGPGLHLQEEFGEIDAREQGGDPLAQRHQARRLRQLVQPGQHRPVAPPDPLDPHRRVRRQPRRDLTVGVVEPCPQRGQFHPRVRRAPQRAEHLGTDGRPGRPREQLGARIAPARARRHEEVAPPQALAQLLQGAEGVGRAIDRVAGADDAPAPGRRDHHQGRVGQLRGPLPRQVAEEGQGVEHRSGVGGAGEGDGAEQGRQEAADGRVALDEFPLVALAGRAGEGRDNGYRLRQIFRRHPREDHLADLAVAVAGVEQEGAGLPQPQGRRVEVPQRPQPGALAGPRRAARQVGEERGEQVERVVLRGDLQGAGAGQEGGDPTRLRHPGKGLRAHRSGLPREIVDAAGRHAGEIEGVDAQGAHLGQALERVDQGGGADAARGTAQPVEGGLAGARRHHQQGLGSDEQRT